MCSFAAVGLVFTAFGAIQQFQQQRQQAKAETQSSEFNAAVLRNNAIVAGQQAGAARDVGKVKAAQEQLEARRLIGLQRAGTAGRGGALSAESAQATFQDTAGIGQINATNQRAIAARESLGFTTQASNLRAQAGLTLVEGSNRASALNSAATSSLITGAGSVATKWNSFRTAGVKPFGIA